MTTEGKSKTCDQLNATVVRREPGSQVNEEK